MSWRKQGGGSGLPVWRGADSILNTSRAQAMRVKGCALPAVAVCILISLGFIIGGESAGGRGVDGMMVAIGWVCLIVVYFASWPLYDQAKGLSIREWFSPCWELRATESGFTFSREAAGLVPAARWSARLDDVARVEVGQSSQWEPARCTAEGVFMETSPHELQVFLFMADQSRRVIHSVNASREEAVTLACSVRAWIDATKLEASARLETKTLQNPAERREGFDV